MDKLEYLAVMFNRRTKNKKYENMIVNAVYNGVGNEELIPVTQQYVKVQGQSTNKYHLLDLYFPQLNFGVEVDEGPHENEENLLADKIREEHTTRQELRGKKCHRFYERIQEIDRISFDELVKP